MKDRPSPLKNENYISISKAQNTGGKNKKPYF